MRAAAGLLGSVALLAGTAGAAIAEPLPATVSIETSVTGYLGGWWQQQIAFSVSCDGYGSDEVWVDLPGETENAIENLGPVPAGTRCWIEVSGYPEAGDDGTDWDPEIYTPGWEFWLVEGDNHITMTLPRTWIGEWPPQDDAAVELDLQLTIDRVYINGRGGIEVEGSSWCPEAAEILTGDFEGDLYANAAWDAVQYVGRKTALVASYESAIAHPCWVGGDPTHGPYRWQTRYPYPDGSLQWVYAVNGRFGSGTIHIEASAGTETWTISQNFAPGGYTSDEMTVPYDAGAPDGNGDGWSVTHYFWFGWDQADLKPIKAR
jgi:hypothetical protein